jgi:hypothetical protein
MPHTMAALVPPLLLALFGAWCGTFAWGATAAASAVAAVALLGTLLWTGPAWQDPLRLGRAGRLLPPALWIAAAASAWASPVPRAGWVPVLLLPAFLALPGAVERCWRREEDRRRGLRALALTVAGVSLWSLIDWAVLGSPRPAMPLGHHNLLAAWLVIALPLAVLPAREPGRWRFAGLAAGGLAVAALLASRSLGDRGRGGCGAGSPPRRSCSRSPGCRGCCGSPPAPILRPRRAAPISRRGSKASWRAPSWAGGRGRPPGPPPRSWRRSPG